MKKKLQTTKIWHYIIWFISYSTLSLLENQSLAGDFKVKLFSLSQFSTY